MDKLPSFTTYQAGRGVAASLAISSNDSCGSRHRGGGHERMCLGPFDAEEPEAGCVGMPGPRFTQYGGNVNDCRAKNSHGCFLQLRCCANCTLCSSSAWTWWQHTCRNLRSDGGCQHTINSICSLPAIKQQSGIQNMPHGTSHPSAGVGIHGQLGMQSSRHSLQNFYRQAGALQEARYSSFAKRRLIVHAGTESSKQSATKSRRHHAQLCLQLQGLQLCSAACQL